MPSAPPRCLAALSELGGPLWGASWEVGGLLPRVECHGRLPPFAAAVEADLGRLQSLRGGGSHGNAGNIMATGKSLLSASMKDSQTYVAKLYGDLTGLR
jgi:hypothetical protein